jgi:sialidase-1
MLVWRFLILVGTLAAATGAAGAEFEESILFNPGLGGYPRLRNASLIVEPGGDLLAFCEGRKDGRGATGNIDIVVRRSRDSGRTWGELETVVDLGSRTCLYCVPVIDRATGTLWLPFTVAHGDDVEQDIVAGTSRERTRPFVTSSTDGGRTWATPRDISATARKPEWTWYGFGPGIGVQLADGRLVVPAYHNVEGTKEFSSHMVTSDDHGATWLLRGDVGRWTGECQVAVRRDGTLVVNARNQSAFNWDTQPLGPNPRPTDDRHQRRLVAESTDRGDTWGPVRTEDAMYEGVCQGALYAWPDPLPDGRPLWLFTNPGGPGRHRNLTLRASRDEGRTWPVARVLHEGDSQTSGLVRLPDGRIGCVYERWEEGNYRLWFARIALEWLLP